MNRIAATAAAQQLLRPVMAACVTRTDSLVWHADNDSLRGSFGTYEQNSKPETPGRRV